MKQKYFTKKELNDYDRLLYVYADTKRVKAIEFIDKKKRVLLNKEREVRKTKAGGFAQGKYQKHVKLLKKKTKEWQERQLLKEGVLREKYDKIKLDVKDEKQRNYIWNLLKKRETNKKWFEKFRNFKINDSLVVGGKDRKSNEELLRKYLDKEDIVLHTEAKGSPFYIVKDANEESVRKAAVATAYYSQDYKKNKKDVKVMLAKGKQIRKKKGMEIGTFSVDGKREVIRVKKEDIMKFQA